jgi:hypothetical protein
MSRMTDSAKLNARSEANSFTPAPLNSKLFRVPGRKKTLQHYTGFFTENPRGKRRNFIDKGEEDLLK